MLPEFKCTVCGKPYDYFLQWSYWPEDEGHEACMKEAERLTEASLHDLDDEPALHGSATTLAELYEQEGGPPAPSFDRWDQYLTELTHIVMRDLWFELANAAKPHTPWREGPNERRILNLGVANVLAPAFQSWVNLELSQAAQAEGERMEKFMQELERKYPHPD
jgi:hypothetical protein